MVCILSNKDLSYFLLNKKFLTTKLNMMAYGPPVVVIVVSNFSDFRLQNVPYTTGIMTMLSA